MSPPMMSGAGPAGRKACCWAAPRVSGREETLEPAVMLFLLLADLGIHQIRGCSRPPCPPQQVPPLDVCGKSTASAASRLLTALARPRAPVGRSALSSLKLFPCVSQVMAVKEMLC